MKAKDCKACIHTNWYSKVTKDWRLCAIGHKPRFYMQGLSAKVEIKRRCDDFQKAVIVLIEVA